MGSRVGREATGGAGVGGVGAPLILAVSTHGGTSFYAEASLRSSLWSHGTMQASSRGQRSHFPTSGQEQCPGACFGRSGQSISQREAALSVVALSRVALSRVKPRVALSRVKPEIAIAGCPSAEEPLVCGPQGRSR